MALKEKASERAAFEKFIERERELQERLGRRVTPHIPRIARRGGIRHVYPYFVESIDGVYQCEWAFVPKTTPELVTMESAIQLGLVW